MDFLRPLPAVPFPRWDGDRMKFEITGDDHAQVPCAISRAALSKVSQSRSASPTDLLKSFVAVHGRIESIALDKLRARPRALAGLLSIWADDIDEPPPTMTPLAAGRAMRQHAAA